MKLTQCLKTATVCCAIFFAWSCQKSIVGGSDNESEEITLPRAASPDRRTHFTGFGYDVTGPYATRSGTRFKIIDVDRLERELVGSYNSSTAEDRTNKNEHGAFAEEYSRKVSNKVSVTAGFSLFGASIGASYSSSNQGSHSYDGKYVYAEKVLTIRKRHDVINATSAELSRYLDPRFESHLNTQTPAWIVANYGTHVMKNIYSGGKLYVLFRGENSSTERENASRSSINVSSGLVFDLETELETFEDRRRYNETTNKELFYHMTGGNTSISIGSGRVNLQNNIRKMLTAEWQRSVSYDNAELVDFASNGLVPIWEVIPDPTKRQQLRNYVEMYLRNNATKNRYSRVPVYSFFTPANRSHGENHLLSTNPVPEQTFLEFHGIKFYAFNYHVPNSLPVYRYYSRYGFNHFYTIRPHSENLTGFVYERIAFYAYPTPPSSNVPEQLRSTVPIFVHFNSRAQNHYFTRSNIPPPYYQAHGTAFHAYIN